MKLGAVKLAAETTVAAPTAASMVEKRIVMVLDFSLGQRRDEADWYRLRRMRLLIDKSKSEIGEDRSDGS